MAFSMMGGFWAPELKYAGYDKVVIRGKSTDLVCLWINNDTVEIRDVSHLKDKGLKAIAVRGTKDVNIAGRAQEYGVDGYTTPQVMAMAVELYEAGILMETDDASVNETSKEKDKK